MLEIFCFFFFVTEASLIVGEMGFGVCMHGCVQAIEGSCK